MDDKIKIILSGHQRNLLLEDVKDYIFNRETERAISAAISKNGKYHIYLTPEDLEELIGSVSFVHNHEEKNKQLISDLDELIDHMECILNDFR